MNSTRRLVIAGNWKMNYGLRETTDFFIDLEKQLKSELDEPTRQRLQELVTQHRLELFVIPPYLSLQKAQSLVTQLSCTIQIAAQNAHWEKSGAFTGEVSGPMLKEIGIQTVLIGHSERRQFFGETNEQVRKRSQSLLDQNFTIILCIGETKEERDADQTSIVLKQQLQDGLPQINSLLKFKSTKTAPSKLILAYELVWAIGTGVTATPEMVEEAHSIIREELSKIVGIETAQEISILYGGSVTPLNIHSLLDCHNVDGVLVGGASLKPDSFFQLIKASITFFKKP